MKTCPKCGKEIEDQVKTCVHCGAVVDNEEKATEALEETGESGDDVQQDASEAVDEETAVPTQPRKRRHWKGVAIAVGLGAVLLISYGVYREQMRRQTYQEAVTLMEQEEYDKAEELFLRIPGYKDTAQYLETIENQRTYDAATQLFEEEKYDEAEAAFKQIEGFKDTADYLEKIAQIRSYREALALYEQGEYAAALQIIDGITVYEPAEKLGETMRSELEYNSYLNLLDRYELTAQSGAMHAHALAGSVSAVWYNAIYKVDDSLTDAYVKDAQGTFFTDFNRALAAYYISESYQQQQETLKEEQKQTGELFAALQNVPAGLEETFEQVRTVQSSFTALMEYALTPAGSYSAYVSQGEKLHQQFTENMSALDQQHPDRLTMHKEETLAAAMTDPYVSVLAVDLQTIASDQALQGEADAYEAFTLAYQEAHEADLSLIKEQMVCSGTEENPYFVLVMRSDDSFDGYAYVKEAADYLQKQEHAGVSGEETDVLLAEGADTDVLMLASREAVETAQQRLTDTGFAVEVLAKSSTAPQQYGSGAEEETEFLSEAEEQITEEGSEGVLESVGELPSGFEHEAETETENFYEVLSEVSTETPTTEYASEGGETVAEELTYSEAEKQTESAGEADTEAVSEAVTEEAASEAAAEKTEEAVSEAAPEIAEETVSEAAPEITEEMVSEAVTEKAEEVVSEAVTEEAEEAVSEAATEKVIELAIAPREEETETLSEEADDESVYESIGETAVEDETETEYDAVEEAETESLSEVGTEGVGEALTEAFSEAWDFLKKLPQVWDRSSAEEKKDSAPETEWLKRGIDPQYEAGSAAGKTSMQDKALTDPGVFL